MLRLGDVMVLVTFGLGLFVVFHMFERASALLIYEALQPALSIVRH